MGPDVASYANPGPLTDLAGLDAALEGVPSDPAAVAAVVRGVVVHPFLAWAHDVEVPPERASDVQVRSAADLVRTVLERDGRPLVEARAPADRFVGNCRHHSVLAVALLRRAGVPARARCGFARYFEAGRWVDHWVVEHWDGSRWVALDAQLDDVQRRLFGIGFDPADLPPGEFLPAGEAWQRCRDGREDGGAFGIMEEWGRWFIVGNVARDLAALNKVEVLPWDCWGSGAARPAPSGELAAPEEVVDELAALTVSGDGPAIAARYASDGDLRVPARVLACWTPDGPVEAEIPELA